MPGLTRRALTLAPLGLLTAAIVGCASAPELRVDRDPSADFASFRSFAFYEPPADPAAPYKSLLAQHLAAATRAELERQGYVYRERDPDLRVNLYLKLTDRVELRETPARRPWGHRGWGTTLETRDYREGTLCIDLVDAQRHTLVWQGVAEGRLDSQARQDPAAVAERTVREILAALPAATTTR